jgi:hypothetical protein
MTTTRPARAALKEDFASARGAAGADDLHVTIADAGEDDDPTQDVLVEFTIQVRDGWPTIASWAIRGTGATATRRSRFPLATYARAALLAAEDALAADGLTHEDIVRADLLYVGSLSTGWVGREFRVVDGRLDDPRTRRPAPRHRAQRRERADDRVERAAAEYRQALERGSRSPTADVARVLDVGRSTAARAISEARERGLLGAALRTAAGEQPE